MDPNAALEELLQLRTESVVEADSFAGSDSPDIDPCPSEREQRMAELIGALDAWLCTGGFFPRRWQKGRAVYVDVGSAPVLLSATEVAERLSLSKAMAYKFINSGVLPVVRLGTAVRIPEDALDRWVAEHAGDVSMFRGESEEPLQQATGRKQEPGGKAG